MFKFPWSNFHELNLDWILEKIRHLEEMVAAITGSATPSSTPPLMDGAAEPGTSENYSRGDHRHPTDTSRASQVDLAAEVVNRDAADGALQSAINAVDAKIKFSSSAPLMDSSSASAGFSDFQARADHIHPTDTSRASQSDFNTLKARVDGITGSASPSDAVPLMDGMGSAGDVGAYSRGNHRHPSDTSKLDVAGGTMTGLLTQSYKERHLAVNAINWLRVANMPQINGSKAVLTITRKSTLYPDEVHKISITINQNDIVFDAEESSGTVVYIDAIRYTNAGKIDIHMEQNYESDIGVFLDPMTASYADMENLHLLPIEAVADAPIGEIILASHKFTDNTSCQALTTTRTNNPYFNETSVQRIKAYSQADMIFVRINLDPDTTLPANTSLVEIGRITLPANRNLIDTIYTNISDQTGTETMLLRISPEGYIEVANYSATAIGQFCRTVVSSILIPTT